MDGYIIDEDPAVIFYSSWKDLDTATIWRIRYDEGVHLRCLRPRCAFPEYNYMMLTVANRILTERGEV